MHHIVVHVMAQKTDGTPEQLDKELVARTLGQLGDRRTPREDAPKMRYWNIAAYKQHDDVHRALLIDSQNPERLYYAWTNDQRTTWKIESSGESVVVDDAEVDTPDDCPDADEYAQEWIEIVVDELRYDAENGETRRSVNDEVEFLGSKTLRLRDVDGRMATFNIKLE